MSALLLLALALPARAAQTLFVSGPAAAPSVVELYTSEGCSSCPPADAWLAGLVKAPGLWSGFIPVGFHVDYWDHLGWTDPLASKAHTARQRLYGRAWKSWRVYTPGLVLNGEEWRGWGGKPPKARRGLGRLELRARGASRAEVRFSPAAPLPEGTRLEAHAVLLGSGLESRVTSGENAGRTLRHEFVVLAHSRGPLRDGAAALLLPRASGLSPKRLALAAWVAAEDSPAPLQAAGGWLP